MLLHKIRRAIYMYISDTLQANELHLTFLALPLIEKFGKSQMHLSLPCMLNVSTFILDIFGRNNSIILHISDFQSFMCFLYAGCLQ